MVRGVSLLALCLIGVTVGGANNIRAAGEGEDNSAAAPDFSHEVLPILSENCFACHGPDKEDRKGKLQLHQREEAIAAGHSGSPAIVPGRSGDSELFARITSGDPDEVMPQPKTGKQLSAEEIDILRRWIDSGAEYREHWAFVPPRRDLEPPVLAPASGEEKTRKNPDHPIDRFIRARLRKESIPPSPPADRSTLIRRVHLDLTGLPPSREEVEAFLRDRRPDAYERVVDRLLGSRHYGEKWARWWLDLAGYGDSDGIRLDDARPHAWRWRQWVVDSLNDDLPYDQFTIRQVAGDLLPGATLDDRMGTGFLRTTITDRQTGNSDPAQVRVRQVADRAIAVGDVWLGLTLGCAECHDHKYDPVSQREFFQLYAYFDNAEEGNVIAPLPDEKAAYLEARPEYERKRRELLAPVARELDALQAEWEENILATDRGENREPEWIRAHEIFVAHWGRREGDGQFAGIAIVKTPPRLRSAEQSERLRDYFLERGRVVAEDRWVELDLPGIWKRIKKWKSELPPVSRAPLMAATHERRETRVHLRGDFRSPGDKVEPGTPAAIPPLVRTALAEDGERMQASSRLDLARWLVSPGNPLPARVAVNRIWQELFGRGLVSSSDNFGAQGEPPSHPELLDWLAVEFQENGWSLKETIRLLVTSRTYRQSSRARPELASSDPGNALLARQARLRLSAGLIRDTSFAAGGILNLDYGGPSVRLPQPEGATEGVSRRAWKPDKGEARYRRGVYAWIQRLSPHVQFANFDLPGANKACSQRERSNTPLQALNLLNDATFVEAAQGLAERVWSEVESDGGDPARALQDRLDHAFLLTVARPPSGEEVSVLGDYLDRQTELFADDEEAVAALAPRPFPNASPAESAAWVTLSTVLLNRDEFISRE